jgi:hypothetical protein
MAIWNKRGIPHVGWTYMHEYDLEDRNGTCEMCGASIRYVCVVYHGEHGVLKVGRQCTAKMTADKNSFASV